MPGAVLAVALLTLGFAVAGPRLGRRLPPSVAVRSLVPALAALAGSGLFVLAVTALTWLGQFPLVAAVWPWSPTVLRAHDPIPAPGAGLALAVLLVLAVSGAAAAVRRGRALLAMRHAAAGLGTVVVIDSDRPQAYATAGPGGRVVVTTGLLDALDPEQRAALLAHERSHLAHHHVWLGLVADLAAAVNPLLVPTARTVRHALERWADEDAAQQTSRRTVAATIARVALLPTPAPGPRPAPIAGPADSGPGRSALGATGGEVPQRVRALLAPPPRPARAALAALAVLAVATIAATVIVERDGEDLFERAAHPAAVAAVVPPAQPPRPGPAAVPARYAA